MTLFIFLFFQLVVKSEVVIEGKIAANDNQYPHVIQLLSYSDGSFVQNAGVDKDGRFRFVLTNFEPGLFAIRVQQFTNEILIGKNEPTVRLAFDWINKTVQNFQVIESSEDVAYKYFFRLQEIYTQKIIEAFLHRNLDSCNILLQKTVLQYNDSLLPFIRDKAATFAAKNLAPAYFFKWDKAYDKNPKEAYLIHFLDNTFVENAVLYQVPMLSARINLLIKITGSSNAAWTTNFLERLFARTSSDSSCHRQLVTLVFSNLLNNHNEEWLKAFVAWGRAHRAEIFNPATATQFEKLQTIMPGNTALEIRLPNELGEQKSFVQTVHNSKVTLLIFWQTTCHHCLQEMPQLRQLYEKYHTEGLEIFAVSIDRNEVDWKTYLQVNKPPWISVRLSDFSNLENAGFKYFVTYTPTLIVVNQQQKIVSRFPQASDYEREILKVLQSK